MGAAASLGELKAQKLCPLCFDVEQPPSDLMSSDYIHYRPTEIKAWLKHWELECLAPLTDAFGIESPQQCLGLTKAHHFHIKQALDDSKLISQWNNGIDHVVHLQDLSSVLTTSAQYSLGLWLECWRLGRIATRIEEEIKCSKRDEVMTIQSHKIENVIIGVRPLELRRWKRALVILEHGIENEQTHIRVSLPSLKTWLYSFELGDYYSDFVKFGADDIRDVLHIEPNTLQKFGFSETDIKRWRCGLRCLLPRSLGVVNSGRPFEHFENNLTLEAWLDCFHLGRLKSGLINLGAVAPVDLLDLTLIEVKSLRLRRMELLRWDRGLLQLRLVPVNQPMRVVMPVSSADLEEILLPEVLHHVPPETANDNLNHLKKVVSKTSSFKDLMNNESWDSDLVDFILTEIGQFVQAQVESNQKLCIGLFARLLDCFQDGERMELLLSQLINDIDLVHSSTTKAMYMRIASALRLLHDQEHDNLERQNKQDLQKKRSTTRSRSHKTIKESKQFVPPPPPVDISPVMKLNPPQEETDTIQQSNQSGPKREVREAWSPKREARMSLFDINKKVLGKLQYRWMATSFTLQGEKARNDWISNFRPPNFRHDEEWLTLDGTFELIRVVLQFTPSEISDFDIEMFFNALDLDGSRSISFYKLVGLLEAENAPNGQKKPPKHKSKRKKKKKVGLIDIPSNFHGPPWKPAGKKPNS